MTDFVTGRDTTAEQLLMPRADLDTLLAVATMYIDAFGQDELMSLTERMRLQEVEDVVGRYGRRR